MARLDDVPTETGGQGDTPRVIELSRDHLWPFAIAVALAVVVAVNLIFIYVAVSGADEVVPSYETETR